MRNRLVCIECSVSNHLHFHVRTDLKTLQRIYTLQTVKMHYHGLVVKGFAKTPGPTAILVGLLSDTNDD